ncbi:MAG: mechanosensitive ion channel domain-containing protein [Campylobacterota bacterium]
MQFLLTLFVVFIAFISAKAVTLLVDRLAKYKSVSHARVFYIKKFLLSLIIFVSVIGVLIILSVDFAGMMLFASSIFAVVGVALFAQWSILSNATASILIFFNFPARVGDCVRIVDGDNTVEGQIQEIGVFHTILSDYDGDSVIYPNNLLLQKAVIKIPSLMPKKNEAKEKELC